MVLNEIVTNNNLSNVQAFFIFTVYILTMFGQRRLNLIDPNCMQIALKKIKPSRLGLIHLSPIFLVKQFIK
jgi:hypothetical protein